MKQTIILTEHDLRRLVKESLNELSYNTISKAADETEYIGGMDGHWIKEALSTIKGALEDYNTPESSKAWSAYNFLNTFFERKRKQYDNFRSNEEDWRDDAYTEIDNIIKTQYPEAYRRHDDYDYNKLDREKIENIIDQLSPKAQEVANKLFWR